MNTHAFTVVIRLYNRINALTQCTLRKLNVLMPKVYGAFRDSEDSMVSFTYETMGVRRVIIWSAICISWIFHSSKLSTDDSKGSTVDKLTSVPVSFTLYSVCQKKAIDRRNLSLGYPIVITMQIRKRFSGKRP